MKRLLIIGPHFGESEIRWVLLEEKEYPSDREITYLIEHMDHEHEEEWTKLKNLVKEWETSGRAKVFDNSLPMPEFEKIQIRHLMLWE